jgi:hypothetical protein
LCHLSADECLAALAAAAPHLATLNLQGCRRLGDDGIAHLAALPALRHILLPARVTDASMQLLLDMPGMPNRRSLAIGQRLCVSAVRCLSWPSS